MKGDKHEQQQSSSKKKAIQSHIKRDKQSETKRDKGRQRETNGDTKVKGKHEGRQMPREII